MTPASYPCPLPGGSHAGEYALAFDQQRPHRLLIVPALFEEASRMRRLTVEVMRRLDRAGIDSFLPDLPGCNESLRMLADQTPASWQAAMAAAAAHFGACHALTVRGGALLRPEGLPGWSYAPADGAAQLRQMLRARIMMARELGREETRDGLLATGMQDGIELAGYRLGAAFLREFRTLTYPVLPGIMEVGQDMLGGSGLWLRAEPGEDRTQADALAAIIAIGIKA